MDNMNWALCGAFSAGGTFAVVNACKVVRYVDSIKLALLFAYLAADTAAAAHCLYCLAHIVRAAHNVNSLTERAHINDIVGTGIGTKSAAHTFFGSNFCQSVFHVDSPIGTDAYAVAQTDTAVFAAPHSAVKALCIGTGLHAVKIKGVLFGIAVARASYNGYTFGQSIVDALGAGLGFTLALLIFSGVRSRVEKADVPETFKGVPATLIAASIVSVSFMSFSGMVEGIFG